MFGVHSAVQRQEKALEKQLITQLKQAGLTHRSVDVSVIMVRVDGTDTSIPEYVISFASSLTFVKDGGTQPATAAIKGFMQKQHGSMMTIERNGKEELSCRPAWKLVRELTLNGGNQSALLYRLHDLEPRS